MNATTRDEAGSLARGSEPFELPAVTYRLLGSKGFRSDEAGNLTAYLQGLSPVKGGWAVGEIARLLFLRHLVERGGAVSIQQKHGEERDERETRID
jgi:hypothetical protein